MIAIGKLEPWELEELREQERRGVLHPPIGTVARTRMERRHGTTTGTSFDRRVDEAASSKGIRILVACLSSILAFGAGCGAAWILV